MIQRKIKIRPKKVEDNVEETEIGELISTLKDLGITDVEIVKHENSDTFWIAIKQGFHLVKHECGIILRINGLKILIKSFQSFLPIKENKTLKSVILTPIKPLGA